MRQSNSRTISRSISRDSIKSLFELSSLRTARYHQKSAKTPEHSKELQTSRNSTAEKIQNISKILRLEENYKTILNEQDNTQENKNKNIKLDNIEINAIDLNTINTDIQTPMNTIVKKSLDLKSVKNCLLSKIKKSGQFLEDKEKNTNTVEYDNSSILIANPKNQSLFHKIGNLTKDLKMMKLNMPTPKTIRVDSGYSSNDNIDDVSDDNNTNDMNYKRLKNKLKALNNNSHDPQNAESLTPINNHEVPEKLLAPTTINNNQLDYEEDTVYGSQQLTANLSSRKSRKKSLQKDNEMYTMNLRRNQRLLSSPDSELYIRQKNLLNQSEPFGSFSHSPSSDQKLYQKYKNITNNSNNTSNPNNSSTITTNNTDTLASQSINELGLKLSLWKTLPNNTEYPNKIIDHLTSIPELFEIKESDKIDEDIQSIYTDNNNRNNNNLLKIDLTKKKEMPIKKIVDPNVNSQKNKVADPNGITSNQGSKPVFKHNLSNIVNLGNIINPKLTIKSQNQGCKQIISTTMNNINPNNNKDKPKSSGSSGSSALYNVGYIFKSSHSNSTKVSPLQGPNPNILLQSPRNSINYPNSANTTTINQNNNSNSKSNRVTVGRFNLFIPEANDNNNNHQSYSSRCDANNFFSIENLNIACKKNNNNNSKQTTSPNSRRETLITDNKNSFTTNNQMTSLTISNNITIQTQSENKPMSTSQPLSLICTNSNQLQNEFVNGNQVKPKEINKTKVITQMLNGPNASSNLYKTIEKTKNLAGIENMKTSSLNKRDHSSSRNFVVLILWLV